MGHKRLIDTVTNLRVQGIVSKEPSISPTFLTKTLTSPYEQILHDFITVVQSFTTQQTLKLDVTHHIITTGPPIHACTRRLS